MPTPVSLTRLAAAMLLPLAAAAQGPALPGEAPGMDSIHVWVGKGDLRAAYSLARAHARDTLVPNARNGYALAAFLLIGGEMDSVLSMLPDDRLSVHPRLPRDPDLGALLGYAKGEIEGRIDSAFGNTEAAAALKLIRQAMADFAAEDRMDALYDPDWAYTWKPSPAVARLNRSVTEHLSGYGNGAYGKALSERFYLMVRKDKTPVGLNILEGGGWMDGRDAGPIWWRSTSFAYEYRFANGFAYAKLGRAVGGAGLAYSLLETERFVLSPFAGVARYPFVANGEYADTRRYAGPDLGLTFDWKYWNWKANRGMLSCYFRSNAGVVIDPGNMARDFDRTSFIYLNFGWGFHLDAFEKYTPYFRDGKVRFRRERDWF